MISNKKKRICVFASASNNLEDKYYRVASELGKLIAKNGYELVYGGSRRGMMYACAESVIKNGGNVYAVMPQKFIDMGFANPDDCKEFYITEGMRERKAKLDELCDAVIAISGGFGTLEEISEMIVQKQLGYNDKPIVILNTDGFYEDLLKFFDNIVDKNFAPTNSKKLYYVVTTPQETMTYIDNYVPDETLTKFARM